MGAIPLPNLSFGFGSSYGPGGSDYNSVAFGNVAGGTGDLPSSFWDKPTPTMATGDFGKIAAYGFAALALVLIVKAVGHKGK